MLSHAQLNVPALLTVPALHHTQLEASLKLQGFGLRPGILQHVVKTFFILVQLLLCYFGKGGSLLKLALQLVQGVLLSNISLGWGKFRPWHRCIRQAVSHRNEQTSLNMNDMALCHGPAVISST